MIPQNENVYFLAFLCDCNISFLNFVFIVIGKGRDFSPCNAINASGKTPTNSFVYCVVFFCQVNLFFCALCDIMQVDINWCVVSYLVCKQEVCIFHQDTVTTGTTLKYMGMDMQIRWSCVCIIYTANNMESRYACLIWKINVSRNMNHSDQDAYFFS